VIGDWNELLEKKLYSFIKIFCCFYNSGCLKMLKDLQTLSYNMKQHTDMVRDLDYEYKKSKNQSSVLDAAGDEEAAMINRVNEQFVKHEHYMDHSDDESVEIHCGGIIPFYRPYI
jgi:hypothetical protein